MSPVTPTHVFKSRILRYYPSASHGTEVCRNSPTDSRICKIYIMQSIYRAY